MSIPRRGEGLCPGPPRPRWGGGPDAPRMGDAPLGEQGEETQPLFRGGPGAIPTTRVSKDDTSDLTETPGWAIPEGQGSPRPPTKGEGYISTAWGAQSPPGRAGSGWCQAGREKTVPRGCWSERYTPSPTAMPGCYWLLRDTGTPSHWLHGGREFPDSVSASVPFSTWHQSQSRGEGAWLGEVSWWAWCRAGRGSRRGVKVEGEPGLGRPLPTSASILPPLVLTLASLKVLAPLSWDGGCGGGGI